MDKNKKRLIVKGKDSKKIRLLAFIVIGGFLLISSLYISTSKSATDTTPPVVAITTPQNGAAVSGTIPVAATASDNVGVSFVRFKLDGADVSGWKDTTSPYGVSWNTVSSANGSHTLTAIARDAADNRATVSITVNVSNGGVLPPPPPPPPPPTTDTTPPTVAITTPQNGAAVSGTIPVAATASDNVGVSFVRFKLDGADVSGWKDTTSPYGVSWNTISSTNGSHTLLAIARDAAGNTARHSVKVNVANDVSPPGTESIPVLPKFETGPSHHSGDTADDSAIWIHPTDPSLSTVIGDDKGGGMMVWNLNGTEIQYIDGTRLLNNVDLRYNFPLQGTFSDGAAHTSVALVSVGYENGNSLAFYKVNPNTRKLENAGEQVLSTPAPYGGCMYRSPATGKYYYFVNWKSGIWQQVELSDAGAGKVKGTVVRTHDAGGQTEGCVTDDVHKIYYIGEELVGVWKYGAEPGDGTARVQVDKTGSGGNLTADAEGMSLYYNSDGTGYLIVSSQGNSTVAVYARDASKTSINAYLGVFKVMANGIIDATTGSDGLDVTNFPLGSLFPQGLFVVHDASNSGGSASNHKLVPWENVAAALNLLIDTSWDPRKVGF